MRPPVPIRPYKSYLHTARLDSYPDPDVPGQPASWLRDRYGDGWIHGQLALPSRPVLSDMQGGAARSRSWRRRVGGGAGETIRSPEGGHARAASTPPPAQLRYSHVIRRRAVRWFFRSVNISREPASRSRSPESAQARSGAALAAPLVDVSRT